jgi:transcriptional regulator with XRE-family HTH domain
MIQGDRLRRLRVQAATTQTVLGFLIGQDQQYVSKLERAMLRGMTVETPERICRALQVSTDYLLDFSCTATSPASDTLPPRWRPQAVPGVCALAATKRPAQPITTPVTVTSPPTTLQLPPETHRAAIFCPHCAIPMQPWGRGHASPARRAATALQGRRRAHHANDAH